LVVVAVVGVGVGSVASGVPTVVVVVEQRGGREGGGIDGGGGE
jgi:hypothetical protein